MGLFVGASSLANAVKDNMNPRNVTVITGLSLNKGTRNSWTVAKNPMFEILEKKDIVILHDCIISSPNKYRSKNCHPVWSPILYQLLKDSKIGFFCNYFPSASVYTKCSEIIQKIKKNFLTCQ